MMSTVYMESLMSSGEGVLWLTTIFEELDGWDNCSGTQWSSVGSPVWSTGMGQCTEDITFCMEDRDIVHV